MRRRLVLMTLGFFALALVSSSAFALRKDLATKLGWFQDLVNKPDMKDYESQLRVLFGTKNDELHGRLLALQKNVGKISVKSDEVVRRDKLPLTVGQSFDGKYICIHTANYIVPIYNNSGARVTTADFECKSEYQTVPANEADAKGFCRSVNITRKKMDEDRNTGTCILTSLGEVTSSASTPAEPGGATQ